MRTILMFILSFTGFAGAFAQNKSTWSNDVNVNPQPGRYYRNERVVVAFDGTIFVGHIVANTPDGLTNKFEILMSQDGGLTYDTFVYNSPYYQPHTRMTAFDMAGLGNDSASFKLIFSRAYVDTSATAAIDTITLTIDTFNLYENYGMAQYYEEFTQYDPYHRGYTSVSIATDTRDRNDQADPYFACVAAVKSGPQDSVIVFTQEPNANNVAVRKAVYGTFNEIRTVSASIGSADVNSSGYGRLGVAWDEFVYHFDSFGAVKAVFVYPDDALEPINFGPYTIGTNNTDYRKPTICLSQQGGNIGSASYDIRAIVAYEHFAGNGDVDLSARVADSIMTVGPTFNEGFLITDDAGIQRSVHSVYEPNSDKFLFTYFDAFSNYMQCVSKTVTSPANDNPYYVMVNYRNATTAINTDAAPRVDIRISDGKPAFVWNDNYETSFDAEYLPSSVAGEVNVQDMKLYPNPAVNCLNMSFASLVNDQALVSVYDMAGRQLATQGTSIAKGANAVTISLQQLPAGNYLLKLKGSSTDLTAKFVIIK